MEAINTLSELSNINPFLLGIVLIWSLAWKGAALWRAGRDGDKYWFIAIFLINTLGILEIVYLFFVSKRDKTVSGG